MDNQPYQSFQQPQQMPPQPQMPGGQPMNPVPTTRLVPVEPKGAGNKNLIWMILTIIAGLVTVTFIALFIWMFSKWDTAQKTVDSQVNLAVANAVNEKTEELESQFIEREKEPYQTFAGPADYGELSFEYPKTWSVYEAKDATTGGDYEAYLNPGKVYPVGTNTINALRVIIKDQSYESFVSNYENNVKNGKLAVNVRLINGENANLYSGELPSSKLTGIAAVFKIRDKVAILQTDAMIFEEDYQKILDSVRYNQ